MEGILKDLQETILAKCNARPWKEVNGVEKAGAFLIPSPMTLEFISSSDAKEGVVKAANMLFLKYKDLNEDKPKFTESLVDEALQLVGCSGPEPDLLLIYGPARCHLGFPAWRLSYTEIV
ncbi:Dehydrodolichyl diphosphate synthase complex subunit Nus1 [Bienertia sinuspersici]